jgi:hypothetical protein
MPDLGQRPALHQPLLPSGRQQPSSCWASRGLQGTERLLYVHRSDGPAPTLEGTRCHPPHPQPTVDVTQRAGGAALGDRGDGGVPLHAHPHGGQGARPPAGGAPAAQGRGVGGRRGCTCRRPKCGRGPARAGCRRGGVVGVEPCAFLRGARGSRPATCTLDEQQHQRSTVQSGPVRQVRTWQAGGCSLRPGPEWVHPTAGAWHGCGTHHRLAPPNRLQPAASGGHW